MGGSLARRLRRSASHGRKQPVCGADVLEMADIDGRRHAVVHYAEKMDAAGHQFAVVRSCVTNDDIRGVAVQYLQPGFMIVEQQDGKVVDMMLPIGVFMTRDEAIGHLKALAAAQPS